ncbi:MAG: hypothetical protein ABI432_00465 [Flavobacteriales bacterium]
MVANQGCPLTGYEAKDFGYVGSPGAISTLLTYTNAAVGRVLIGELFYQGLVNVGQRRPLLAGYCRQEYEASRKPIVLVHGPAEELERTLKYPKTLKEKEAHILQYVYAKGGNEGKWFDFQSKRDYPLCYCTGPAELEAVMSNLIDRDLVECRKTHLGGYNNTNYHLRLRAHALDELEAHLSHGPMVGLTSQTVVTSNPDWNTRISHAIDLFNEQPRTKERMRSAVVELSAVLEPLRGKLEEQFGKKDTNVFFQLVNEFDVRHNKNEINRLEHDEQLEWLYYAFLNTLNTYAKLERKLNPVR